MSLLGLSDDILRIIFSEFVFSLGICGSVSIRTVCKLFDHYIQHALFTLPSFESEDRWSARLSPDPRMSYKIVARLNQSKIDSPNASDRWLVSTLRQAVDTIIGELGYGSSQQLTVVLTEAAAAALPVRHVVRYPSPQFGLESRLDRPELLDIALLAVSALGDVKAVRCLLRNSACSVRATKFFGHAMSAAARAGHKEVLASLFGAYESASGEGAKLDFQCRLGEALVAAASQGHSEIIQMLVQNPVLTCRREGFYDMAIGAALRASYLDVVNMMVQHRSDTADGAFWETLLRTTVSKGQAEYARYVLNSEAFQSHQNQGRLSLALEDASRLGYLPIVKMLLDHRSDKSLHPYTGALYWAARCGNKEILSVLLQTLPADALLMLVDALAGAVYSSPETVSHILQETKTDIQRQRLDLGPSAFAAIVDDIVHAKCRVKYDEVVRCTEESQAQTGRLDNTASWDPFADIGADPKFQALESACMNQDLVTVVGILSAREGYSQERLMTLSGCCSAAAYTGRPGFLLYLCQKLPPFTSSEVAIKVRSTSIMQVFLDHGWDANMVFHRLKPPALGHVTDDEHLARWLLDHGGDPNIRCDWDITPLSAAIKFGTLSIFKLLLDRGGDVRRGQLLHWAILREKDDAVMFLDWLLCLGVPVNAIRYKEDQASWVENVQLGMGTALHTAVAHNRRDLVSYLLLRGADRSIKDSCGRTVRDLAEAAGNGSIVSLLEE